MTPFSLRGFSSPSLWPSTSSFRASRSALWPGLLRSKRYGFRQDASATSAGALLDQDLCHSVAMGVVSGLVMSYQLGTNWSRFSRILGNIIGPMIGYEVVWAFFLEATFLGIMLFAWNRAPRALHFAATVTVTLGTTMSAFWILSANSWMHTPASF